jgi:hypothetical protein
MSKIKTKKYKNNIRYQVMVSNDYILSKHDLGTQAQQVIINLAKNIQRGEYETDLVEDLNVYVSSGTIQELLDIEHKNLYRIYKRLRDEGIELPTGWDKNGNPTKWRYTGLLLTVDYDTKSGNFILRVDKNLKPHFTQLAKYANNIEYTIANEKEFYILKRKHSLRLYLMFRKIQYQQIWRVIYTVEELNLYFKSKYKNYNALNNNVLKNCVEEINEHTEITVVYHPRKANNSRSYNEIVFDLTFNDVPKNSGKKRLNTKEQLEVLKGSKIVVDESVFIFKEWEHPIDTNEYNLIVRDSDNRIGKVKNIGNSLLELLEYVSDNLLDEER